MKRLFITLIIFLSVFLVHAQNLTPTVIASAGDFLDNGTVSLSFTVGELAVTTLVAGETILTQGFQQPFELDVSNAVVDKPVNWSVKTYPNPVEDNLHIRFTLKNPGDFTVVIMDITGKKVFIKKYDRILSGEVKEIDMTKYAPGIYLISVTSKDQKIRKLYKIRKK